MWNPTSAASTVRGTTFVLWALAAASAVFWGLKLGGQQRAATLPPAPLRPVAAVDPAALAALLGGAPSVSVAAAPSLASRFQLLGVAAGAESGGGAAVIAVDGKPARHYRVGTAIEEGLVLQSVRGRQAVLAAQGTGQPMLTLELPPPSVAVNAPPGTVAAPPAALGTAAAPAGGAGMLPAPGAAPGAPASPSSQTAVSGAASAPAPASQPSQPSQPLQPSPVPPTAPVLSPRAAMPGPR